MTLNRPSRIRAQVSDIRRWPAMAIDWTLRLGSDAKAVSAVEFALVGPLFFITVSFILEVGYCQFLSMQLNAATQAAARTIMTGSAPLTTLTKFRSDILCKGLGTGLNCSDVIVQSRVFASAPALFQTSGKIVSLPLLDVTSSVQTWCPGGGSDLVYLETAYKAPAFLPFESMFGAVTLGGQTFRPIYSSAIIQNEPVVTTTGGC